MEVLRNLKNIYLPYFLRNVRKNFTEMNYNTVLPVEMEIMIVEIIQKFDEKKKYYYKEINIRYLS